MRVVNGVPPTGDYSFAKYNKVRTSMFYKCVLLSIFYLLNSLSLSPFLGGNDTFSNMVFLQSVDILKYSDEEYEKHLTDPVGTNYMC